MFKNNNVDWSGRGLDSCGKSYYVRALNRIILFIKFFLRDVNQFYSLHFSFVQNKGKYTYALR
jgi:hypothetical protein